MEPTLLDVEIKGEEEADGGLSSKVSFKEKLKQFNGADPVVPLPTSTPIILTKKHGLDNLDVL